MKINLREKVYIVYGFHLDYEYEIGDFVKFEDKILKVTHISGHNIHCENLQDRKDFNIHGKTVIKQNYLKKIQK